MLASDADIDLAMEQGLLKVTPTEPELLQPASIDLRLDDRFRFYLPAASLLAQVPGGDPLHDPIPRPVIDPAEEQPDLMTEVKMPAGEPYLLPAGQFVLTSTLEHVEVGASIAAKLEGKSSLGRLGLFVHATAGWIDPGFAGHITLELYNAAPWPIALWPGMRIAQLGFMALGTPARRPYGTGGLQSRYQNQGPGPRASQSWRGFRAWPTRQEPIHA